jgi:hypothetical protein
MYLLTCHIFFSHYGSAVTHMLLSTPNPVDLEIFLPASRTFMDLFIGNLSLDEVCAGRKAFACTKGKKKVKKSLYTPWRRLGGRGGIAPTHSRPRH